MNLPSAVVGNSANPKSQPPGLFLLFVVEMWERFSYYGMRALLVLYLVSGVFSTTLPDKTQVKFVTGATATVEYQNDKGQTVTEKGDVQLVTDRGTADKPNPVLTLAVKQDDGSTVNREIPISSIAKASVVGEGNAGPGWSKSSANTLYGWYTGLAYLLPIVGGLIADRFIGTHRSMIVGGLLIVLGHLTLAASGINRMDLHAAGNAIFIGGLALIVLGTGHFKPCVSVMVGQLYGPDDPRRDGGFTIFYMGINVGAFICAFICGTLGEKVGWHWGFGAAAVGMLAGLGIYTMFREKYLKGIGLPPEGQPNSAPFFLVGSVLLSALVALLAFGGFFGMLTSGIDSAMSTTVGKYGIPFALLAAIGLMIGWLLMLQEPKDRGVVATILVFIGFNTFFWMAFEQAGSSLNLFAAEKTDRMLGSWEVPASWFQSVNSFLVITMAPLFALMWSALGRKGRDPKQATKIGMGLVLLGVGYLFIVFGAKFAATGVRVGMFWLIATYFFHTLGELCLSPTGLAFVTKAAPIKFVSLLMGIWFLSSFLAGVLGGYLAATTDAIEQGAIKLPWYSIGRLGGQADYYMLFVILSVGAGVVALATSPFFSRILKEKA